ncbi:MAG TPA: hypothetical protein VK446_13140, partial [Methylocystis sp.]|nr:hypothetical protein [Methylocystis sp.]
MSSRVVPILVGAALAVACGSAFAFDAQVTRPTPLRTHPSHRAAVIEVVPANAVIDMARCARGWCAAEYAGR